RMSETRETMPMTGPPNETRALCRSGNRSRPGPITGAAIFSVTRRRRPAVGSPSRGKGGTMFRSRLRAGLAHVGLALREPEASALRWHRDGPPSAWWVFAALALTAIAGTLSYGMTLGVLGGPRRMAACALACTAAAGIGWGVPLPALYILNSLSGSRLRA